MQLHYLHAVPFRTVWLCSWCLQLMLFGRSVATPRGGPLSKFWHASWLQLDNTLLSGDLEHWNTPATVLQCHRSSMHGHASPSLSDASLEVWPSSDAREPRGGSAIESTEKNLGLRHVPPSTPSQT